MTLLVPFAKDRIAADKRHPWYDDAVPNVIVTMNGAPVPYDVTVAVAGLKGYVKVFTKDVDGEAIIQHLTNGKVRPKQHVIKGHVGIFIKPPQEKA